MLKQFISKEDENEKKILNMEQQLKVKEEENEKKILNLTQQLISKEEENEKRILNMEQQLKVKEEENEKKILNLEQQLISKVEENEKCIQVLIGDDSRIRLQKINIKSKISSFIEMFKRSNEHYLCCNGIVFDSNRLFSSYFISNNSVIYFIYYKDDIVYIKKNINDYMPISFNSNSKVDDLISKLSFFQKDKHKLMYQDKELKMGTNLQDYSIINGSVITISPSINIINVCINKRMCYYGGETAIVSVNLTDKINVLKEYIEILFS